MSGHIIMDDIAAKNKNLRQNINKKAAVGL